MRILLDTHVFLWYISADKRLPEKVLSAIRDSNNEIYLSVVTLWEATIKYQLGKLPLPSSPELYLPSQRRRHLIRSLSVDERSVSELIKLPPHHRDPFDRLLICQATANNMVLATVDDEMRNYSVSLL